MDTTKFPFDFNKLRVKDRKHYGKFPEMYLQIDPLTTKNIDFDDVAFAKLGLIGYNEEKILNIMISFLHSAYRMYRVSYFFKRRTIIYQTTIQCECSTTF